MILVPTKVILPTPLHFIETAFITITSDLHIAKSKGHFSVLFTRLSAVFDQSLWNTLYPRSLEYYVPLVSLPFLWHLLSFLCWFLHISLTKTQVLYHSLFPNALMPLVISFSLLVLNIINMIMMPTSPSPSQLFLAPESKLIYSAPIQHPFSISTSVYNRHFTLTVSKT